VHHIEVLTVSDPEVISISAAVFLSEVFATFFDDALRLVAATVSSAVATIAARTHPGYLKP
jgi:hypothetical protein